MTPEVKKQLVALASKAKVMEKLVWLKRTNRS